MIFSLYRPEPLEFMTVPSGRPPDHDVMAKDGTFALAGHNILVVEDEALVAFDLEMALSDAGAIPIGPAVTLQGAMRLSESTRFEAAILDVDLNGVDVYPLADVLLQRKVPFVFHTGHGLRENLRDIYPNIPVCQKPCSPDEVIKSLARHLSRPQ